MKRIFLIIAISIITFQVVAPNTCEKASNEILINFLKRERIKEIRSSEFSIQNLVTYLELLEIKNKTYIISQFVLETGWFKSKSFTAYNNISGMKLPKIRKTLAIGTGLRHAAYSSWTDSVDDYLIWLDYYENRGYDTSNHLQFLKKVGYAESPVYCQLVKQIEKTVAKKYMDSNTDSYRMV